MVSPKVLIDTMRVMGKVTIVREPDLGFEKSSVNRATGEIASSLPVQLHPAASLILRRKRDGQKSAVIEGSMPRQRRNHNVEASPLPEALSVVTQLYEEAKRYVRWHVPAHELEVRRLDLVRDIVGVESLSRYTPYWTRRSVPRETSARSRPVVISDPSRGSGTFYRGSREYRQAAVYDKASWVADVEPRYLDAASTGLVRFEARYQSKALQQAGIRQISDLEEVTLERLRRRVWDAYGLGEIVGGNRSLAKVLHEAPLDSRLKAYIAWEAACHLDGVQSGLSKYLRRQALAAAHDLGLDFTDFSGTDLSVRLDYDEGREVVVGETTRLLRRHPADTMLMRLESIADTSTGATGGTGPS